MSDETRTRYYWGHNPAPFHIGFAHHIDGGVYSGWGPVPSVGIIITNYSVVKGHLAVPQWEHGDPFKTAYSRAVGGEFDSQNAKKPATFSGCRLLRTLCEESLEAGHPGGLRIATLIGCNLDGPGDGCAWAHLGIRHYMAFLPSLFGLP